MARRKRYEDDSHENHERWLISYADFITLLFAFFVVMYAVSVVNVGKYKVLSDALGDAFGGRGAATKANTQHRSRGAAAVEHHRPQACRSGQARPRAPGPAGAQAAASLAPLVRSGKVRVTQNARGVTVEINASVLFDEGDAALAGSARETLQSVAGLLKDDRTRSRWKGHTDTTPIANAAFPSNWELSAVRASTVVRLFVESGVPRAPGRGRARRQQPIASNDDPIGRARNRRVAVTILSGM
jgi:chemotaxis protein MotB